VKLCKRQNCFHTEVMQGIVYDYVLMDRLILWERTRKAERDGLRLVSRNVMRRLGQRYVFKMEWRP